MLISRLGECILWVMSSVKSFASWAVRWLPSWLLPIDHTEALLSLGLTRHTLRGGALGSDGDSEAASYGMILQGEPICARWQSCTGSAAVP